MSTFLYLRPIKCPQLKWCVRLGKGIEICPHQFHWRISLNFLCGDSSNDSVRIIYPLQCTLFLALFCLFGSLSSYFLIHLHNKEKSLFKIRYFLGKKIKETDLLCCPESRLAICYVWYTISLEFIQHKVDLAPNLEIVAKENWMH